MRALLDEIFGEDNFVALISVKKTGGVGAKYLDTVFDYILWYGRDTEHTKYRPLFEEKVIGKGKGTGQRYDQVQIREFEERPLTSFEKKSEDLVKEIEDNGGLFFQLTSLNSESSGASTTYSTDFEGNKFYRTNWKTSVLVKLVSNELHEYGVVIRQFVTSDSCPILLQVALQTIGKILESQGRFMLYKHHRKLFNAVF